jgi:serine/threonine protein kinase
MCRKEAKKLYPNMKRIDSGGTATVYLGKKEGEGLVAIKCILLYSSISPNIKLSGEIRTMKDYPHPNIVIYIDSFIYASKGVEELWLVMEYMAGGNLHDLASYAIARKSPIWTEGIMAAVLKSILSGIEHLHKNSIIHRDIKGANVLLNAAAQIKLGNYNL